MKTQDDTFPTGINNATDMSDLGFTEPVSSQTLNRMVEWIKAV